MKPYKAFPSQEQEPAEEDKENKTQMEHHNKIGTQSVQHRKSVEEIDNWRKRSLE